MQLSWRPLPGFWKTKNVASQNSRTFPHVYRRRNVLKFLLPYGPMLRQWKLSHFDSKILKHTNAKGSIFRKICVMVSDKTHFTGRRCWKPYCCATTIALLTESSRTKQLSIFLEDLGVQYFGFPVRVEDGPSWIDAIENQPVGAKLARMSSKSGIVGCLR